MFKLFLFDFFTGKLWKWLFGGVGGLLGIFLIGKNFLSLNIFYSLILGVGIFIAIFFVAFLRYVMINTHRRNPYGDAIVLLKDGFARINELKRTSSTDPEQIMNALVQMCDSLKAVFDRLTKTNCSISIKLPLRDEPISNNATVENICRDYQHYLLRNTDEYKKLIHYVNGNTPYRIIINRVLNGNRKEFYYLNNDVPGTIDYESTSKPAYIQGVLPYKSELVYPILPMSEPKEKTEEGKMKYEIWGFLCIDCPKKHRFNNGYHVQIVEGVADGLFDVIIKLKRLRTLTYAK